MQTNNFKSLSMGVLCALSLVGCMEKDLYQAPEEKTADEYFGFTTSSSCTVDVNYGLNYQVVFELYAENPLEEDEDGNIIKTKKSLSIAGLRIKKEFLMISYPFHLILQNFTFIQTIWELSARFNYKLQTEKYLLIRKLLYKVREMRRVRVEGLPIAATNIRKVFRF